MKKDIFCYLLLIISIGLFLCTYVFLEPIELLEEEHGDFEEIEIEDIYEKGLENKELVEEQYIGGVQLNNKWTDFVLLFTAYKDEFIQEYEKYNSIEQSEEKSAYEKEIYLRYGIDTQEERDYLYQKLKNTAQIIKIEVVEDTISIEENGIVFDIKAMDENSIEYLFNTTIFNEYSQNDKYLKILPKN